jgi:uncharacterized membrane protein YecN with MAPEG domain
MTIPVWVLIGFALWTVATLMGSVGVYRWSRILTGRSQIREFRGDQVEGPDFYRRAMRAHANCLESLPIYTALVVAIVARHASSPLLDVLALVLLGARIVHTVVHIGFEQTNRVAAFRFTFFFVQIICLIWMGLWLLFTG